MVTQPPKLMASRAESDRRYDQSEKGRARRKKYRQSDKGREVRRLQSERYYANPAKWGVHAGKIVRRTTRAREARLDGREDQIAALNSEIERLLLKRLRT